MHIYMEMDMIVNAIPKYVRINVSSEAAIDSLSQMQTMQIFMNSSTIIWLQIPMKTII